MKSINEDYMTNYQISNLFRFHRNQSEAKVASPFIVRMLYDDNMTYNIVEATSEVTGKSLTFCRSTPA